ncbi:MAG: DUF1918 domain-containing protein [Micrococcales bacterium]|nr:DUF1918 domain-containing protein [Micrococcales bacterium]
MHANPGDHIVLSPAGDAPARAGEVLEARGPGHTAPFVVLWDDGSQSLVYPGPGSVLRVTPVTTPHAARARRLRHRGPDRRARRRAETTVSPVVSGARRLLAHPVDARR